MFNLPNVIRRSGPPLDFTSLCADYGAEKVLNIGAGSSAYADCINLDLVARANTDVVADAHRLPFADESFDLCLMCAVLQYCEDPPRALDEAYRVLRPGGMVLIDAPFIQPVCYDQQDLFRFTKEGLIKIASKRFGVVSCEVCIPSGSTLAFYCQRVFFNCSNRYLSFALKYALSILLYPLAYLLWNSHEHGAGAFVLLARKPFAVPRASRLPRTKDAGELRVEAPVSPEPLRANA